MKNKSKHEHRRQNIGQAHTTIPPQKYVTRKFDVLVLQNSIVVVQTTAKKDKKYAARANLFFC